MPLVEKRIYRISDDLSSLNAQQIGVQDTNDADLGYKMYGGKDDAGVLGLWPAKDKAARFSTLGLIGGSTTGDTGLLRHDTSGNITGGQITISDLNDLISDGEVGLWQRDGIDNVLSPATVGDKIKVGAGTVAVPGVAVGDSNTGAYYDLSTSRLCLAQDGVPSWQFELADTDVHRILVGDDQTSPNQRYFHLKWEESDYEGRSAARIENYRGSGAPGADGTFTISNNVQDGTFGTMTVTNFHPGNSTTTISATGGASKVDISASGTSSSEIKNTASHIWMNGQTQAQPSGDQALPEYSFYGKTDTGFRYDSGDDDLRFVHNAEDILTLTKYSTTGINIETETDRQYFTIKHARTSGSNEPTFTLQCSGTGSIEGSKLSIQSLTSVTSSTPAVLELYSSGGYANTYIDAIAGDPNHNAAARLASTANGGSANTNIFAETSSSNSGHGASLFLTAKNTGAGNSTIWIGTDVDTGTSAIYVGTDASHFVDGLYFVDVNKTSASPAWSSYYGVPLSTNAAAWDNYKATFGEVGLMDAISAAKVMDGFTSGSIPYADGSGILTEDASNLYFKDTGFKLATTNTSGAAAGQIAATSFGGDCDISFRAYGGVNDDTSVVISGTTSGTGLSEITIAADGGGTASYLLLDTPPGNSSIRIDTNIGFEDSNRSGSTWGGARIDLSASSAEWSNMEALIGSEGSLFGGILAAAEVLVVEGSGDTANSTSSGTFQQRIRVTTPALTSGVKYLILWSCELQAQADCEVQGRVQLNDTTTIAEPYYDNDPYATRGTCQGGIYYSDTLSGVQNIDLDWRKAYDPGSGALVYCGRARIVVLRVGL